MGLNSCVLNHGGAVYGIRNLLRQGIDCKAIVWNQAVEKYCHTPAAMPYTLTRDSIPNLRLE